MFSEDKARNILALGDIVAVNYPVLDIFIGNISVRGILKIFYLLDCGLGYGVKEGCYVSCRAAFVAHCGSLNLYGAIYEMRRHSCVEIVHTVGIYGDACADSVVKLTCNIAEGRHACAHIGYLKLL